MNIYIAVFLVTGVISLAGYLWLSMVAFKRSIPWGLLVLLLSPITAIVFALMHWFESRKPFVVYISSFLLFAGSAVLIMGNVGMGNMQQIFTRMQSGKMPPARAYGVVLKALQHPGATDLFAETSPVNAAPPAAEAGTVDAKAMTATQVASPTLAASSTENAPLPAKAVTNTETTAQTKPETHTQVADKTAESSPKPPAATSVQTPKQDSNKAATKTQEKVPLIKQAEPDPLAQKTYVPPSNTVTVRMDRMPKLLGKYFIIKLKDGVERRGLLSQVTSTHLMLDRKLYGGNLRYRIRKTQVRSIKMLTRLPDER